MTTTTAVPDGAGPTAAIGQLFHTGLIVDDLEAEMARLHATTGATWGPISHHGSEIWTEQGPCYREAKVVYTTTGPHHLELIEYTHPDLPARFAAHGRPHHLGYDTPDWPAAADALAAAGYTQRFRSGDPGRRASYHTSPGGGLWIELVEHDLRLVVDRWIRGEAPLTTQVRDAPN